MLVADRLIRLGVAVLIVTLSGLGTPLVGAGQEDPAVVHRLGVLDGEEADVFGLIEDAGFLEGGRWLVLDSRLQELRLYSGTNQRLLQRIGGAGRGPGEFFVPEAVDAWPGGAVVLDRGNGRISFYSFEANGVLSLADDVPIGFQAWDLCTVEDRLFVATDAWETPIAEIGKDGKVIRKFGSTPPPHRLPVDTPENLVKSVAYTVRKGFLDCSPAGVTWVSRATGEIQHFDMAGREVLRSQLTGFGGSVPEFTVRRTVRYVPANGLTYVDVLQKVIHIDGGRVWIHARRFDYETRESFERMFELDLATGVSGVHLGNWPALHAVGGGVALGSVEEPFPQFLILDVSRVPVVSGG